MKPRKIYIQRKCNERVKTVEELTDPTKEDVTRILNDWRTASRKGVWYFTSTCPCHNWK